MWFALVWNTEGSYWGNHIIDHQLFCYTFSDCSDTDFGVIFFPAYFTDIAHLIYLQILFCQTSECIKSVTIFSPDTVATFSWSPSSVASSISVGFWKVFSASTLTFLESRHHAVTELILWKVSQSMSLPCNLVTVPLLFQNKIQSFWPNQWVQHDCFTFDIFYLTF